MTRGLRYRYGQHAARSTDEYVFHQLLPYLGNKRNLLELIDEAVEATGVSPDRATFVDAFAGSGVVSRYAKQRGFAVVSNDWEPYARVVNTAAVTCDAAPALASVGGYERAIAALNALQGTDGWVTKTLCPADDDDADPRRERMFYRRVTGRRIDAVRQQIEDWGCDEEAAACLLAPLLYQACWLANTSGVFKGYHAGWGGANGTALHRILADLELQPLRFHANGRRHRVLSVDAASLGAHLEGEADVAYLDPPYNQHPYASNYHVLNSLVLWDQPELPPPTARGFKAAIRPDWKERRSDFNGRGSALAAFASVMKTLPARHVLISYSTDGMMPLEQLVTEAAEHGAVRTFHRSYKRYRTSPTRPSPRPRNLEFVLHVDRGARRRRADTRAALEQLEAAAAERYHS